MEFRFKALRHQHDPDDLDTTVNLANPKSWIAVFVTLLVLVAASAWGLLGSLPQTVSGSGVLSRADSVLRVEVGYPAVVSRLNVVAGQHVDAGAALVTVADEAGALHTLSSPAQGTVMVAAATAGEAVDAGETLVTVERAAGGGPGLSAMMVVPVGAAVGIRPGMGVDLSVAAVSSQIYGLLRGRVLAISPYPLTALQLRSLVYDPATVASMMSTGSVDLVTVELLADPATTSGYSWSSPAGPPYHLDFQSGVSGDIHLGQRRPVDYVFGDSS